MCLSLSTLDCGCDAVSAALVSLKRWSVSQINSLLHSDAFGQGILS